MFVFLMLFDSEATKDAAIENLQKQIDDIVQELNILKEHQALQTGKTKKRADLLYISNTISCA